MINKRTRLLPFLRQCFVTASVYANVLGHGCIIGFPAIMLPLLLQPDSPIPLTKEQGSWIASVGSLLMLVGAFIMMPLLECSRKTAHYAATAPALVGWTFMILATNFLYLLIGRILCGISVGMLHALRSVIIGEYTSQKNRGAFLAIVSFSQAFGVFFIHLLGSILSWKTSATISALFAVASLVMTIFSPESPSWLAYKGRYDECRKAFQWLRGDEENDELEAMISARMAQQSMTENKRINFKTLKGTIRKKEFYKPLAIMGHASLLALFSGATIMATYATDVLGHMMGPESNVNFWMVFLDAQRLLVNAAAVLVINKVKRRTMLFSTGVLCVLSLLAIAAYMIVTKGEHSKIVWLAALLASINMFSIAIGMLPIPEIISGEVCPIEYKGIGGVVRICVLSTLMFGIIKTYPSLVDTIGLEGVCEVYAGVMTYGLVILWYLLPETTGKTLQQIEDEFKGKSLGT